MKTGIKKITKLFGLLLLTVFVIQSCSDVAGPSKDSNVVSENYNNSTDFKWSGSSFGSTSTNTTDGSTDLFFGRDRVVIGKVYFSINSDDNLEVRFHVTNSDYPISETNVWVGTNLSGVPQSASGPKLGHFPYITSHRPAVYDFTYVIDPSDHGISNPYDNWIRIVTHAVVGNNETAFAGCYEMLDSGSRWWNAINWYNGITWDSVEKCNDIEGKRTNGQP